MTTLVICWSVFLGICVQVVEVDYPTFEQCDHERFAILTRPNPPDLIYCKPKVPMKGETHD